MSSLFDKDKIINTSTENFKALQILVKGKCIVCGKEATDLLFCDDCNRKRKEIEMKKEQLRKGIDIEKRIITINNILDYYNNFGSAIIGISITNDILDSAPVFNILLTKKFQDEVLKLLKEYRASLEEEFENL